MIGVSIMVESFRESLRTYLVTDDPRGSLHHRARPWLRPAGAPHRAGRAARPPRAARRSPSTPRAAASSSIRIARTGAASTRSAWSRRAAQRCSSPREIPTRRGRSSSKARSSSPSRSRGTCSSKAGTGSRCTPRTATQPFEVAGIYREYGNDQGSMHDEPRRLQPPVARRCDHRDGPLSAARARMPPTARGAACARRSVIASRLR